ncbi:MAG: HD domain-containing protein [Chitinophagaceae bacterium]
MKQKIINDPVYGFITIEHPLIFKTISHPFYQRLRRIHQMALAYLVYPGAVHTRLLHSLGAYHLMCQAITELKNKGTEISFEEELAVKAGILLHDIGHGPFSHALENVLTPGINHEEIGLQIMHKINEELNGELSLTIKIFTNNYHKKFLHQLISSQLDVDRMDYLTRDSFFTGVSEGVIGYSRILKMLIVHNGELMIEEKGIYSVEKFLVARRQMYWQVYLHKTVLAAEKMLIKIIERAKEIYDENDPQLKTNSSLDFFLQFSPENINTSFLNEFCMIDDTDVIAAIKRWSLHPDTVLSLLCNSVLNRNLFKCKLLNEPINEDFIIKKRKVFSEKYNVSIEESAYFIFSGDAENSMYKPGNEHINIFFKDETVKEISQIENALIHQTISAPVKKFYICELQ